MEHYQGIVLGIVAVCAFCLLVIAIRRKSELLVGVVWRMIMGTLLICFGNMGLAYFGFSGGIGINLTTLLTSAILGFWGVTGLFAMFFCVALA